MEIKTYCEHCGSELENEIAISIDQTVNLKIISCIDCMSDAKFEGYKEGEEKGYSDGLLAGDK